MPSVLGTPIDTPTANNLLRQRIFIKSLSDTIISNTLVNPANKAYLNSFERPTPVWFKHFYNKVRALFNDRGNAYVFSREAVLRFFFHDDQLDSLPYPADRAEYLMIWAASQYESSGGLFEGNGTTVIAGCNDTSSGQQTSFTTLPLAKPAAEHPPRLYEPQLPLALIEFQAKVNDMLSELEGLKGKARINKLEEIKKEIADLKIPKEALDDNTPITIKLEEKNY
jgi:hypothetical protein